MEKLTVEDYIHRPFDLSIFHERDAYKVLCYMKLGNQVETKRLPGLAMQNISTMPHTPYKDLIERTYELITK